MSKFRAGSLTRHIEGWMLCGYFLLLFGIGVATIGSVGITWDEPNYFGSSYLYLSWVKEVFADPSGWWSSIDRYWEQSHEAPPFFKLWAGLFALAGVPFVGTENLEALGNFYRMGSYALFLLSTFVAFRFVRSEFGAAEAWGAAVSMPLIPVLFGFARLGQLDGAVASMYVICAVALYSLMRIEVSRRRVALTGVLVGLAFATKITVFPLVVAALVFALIFRRGKEVFLRLAASLLIGAGVFFAIWPWLWRAPVERTYEFLTWAGGLQDERFTNYLGQLWAGAPFHYPLVALVVFVPLIVAVAGISGVIRLLRGAGSPASAWLLINLALVLAVAGSGLTPVYGGPRQFLAAFSLWAIFCGVGFGGIFGVVRRRFGVNLAAALAVYAGLALPGIVWTGAKDSLEYYGEAVGLIPGAHALGFETTYLADTYRPAVVWLNENAPEGATVYVQAGTYPVAESYRRSGRMREDLRPAYLAPIASGRFTTDERPRDGSYFIFLPRQSIYTQQMISLSEKTPLYEYERGGVPLVKVYSGESVESTLGVEGRPEVREVGWPNAAIVGFGLLGVGAVIVRGKRTFGSEEHQEEDGDYEQVSDGDHRRKER